MVESPRPGHLKSLAWPAEDSRAPVAMGGSCPVPSPPHFSARLVVFQVVFLIIFIKASSSGQPSLAPKAHMYCPLYCPSFCICISLFIFCLGDPEDLCGDRSVSPGLAWPLSAFPVCSAAGLSGYAGHPSMFLLTDMCIWGFSVMDILWLEREPYQDRAIFCFWSSLWGPGRC